MPGSYLVAGARTPIGKMSGALASFSAADLGSFAIKAALERAGVRPEEVEHVLMGQVLMAGQGQAPARQAAFKAVEFLFPYAWPATDIKALLDKHQLQLVLHNLPLLRLVGDFRLARLNLSIGTLAA